MKVIVHTLGVVTLSPITILFWLFYFLPLWALGWIKKSHVSHTAALPVVVFDLTKKDTWYHRLWKGWGGFSGPHAVIIKPGMSSRILAHELRHCDQWFTLGILFLPVYGLLTATFGYKDNPLERDARMAEYKTISP